MLGAYKSRMSIWSPRTITTVRKLFVLRMEMILLLSAVEVLKMYSIPVNLRTPVGPLIRLCRQTV